MPTRHPRKMITIHPSRAALLDELAGLEGQHPDLGRLVDEGASARLQRLKQTSASTLVARRRLADRVRGQSLSQDSAAADSVKRLGLA